MDNEEEISNDVVDVFQSSSDQIIEIDRNLTKDEHMLPVHFLPEGKKCYDWVNQDVSDGRKSSKTKKTGHTSTITYTSSNMTNKQNTFDHDTVHKLLKAAEEGHYEDVKNILQTHPSCINLADSDGYTALHRACYSGHESIVLYLIQHGSNVFAQTNDGWQPIHCAARWNQLTICKLLLDHHVDVNATTNGQQTALHFACLSTESIQLLELLLLHPLIQINIKNTAGDTPYDLAHRNGLQYKLFDMVGEGMKI